MGLSNLINNLDVQKAKEWANQQSEAKWAAEQEEKRRQERAEDRKKISGAASKVSGATTGGTTAPKTTGLTQTSRAASSGMTYSKAQEKAAEAPKPKTYGNTELSYSGAGASDRTKELEAQWFAPKQPEAKQPEVTAPAAETGSSDQISVEEAKNITGRKGRMPKSVEEVPVVYSGGTTAGTGTSGTGAAGTKAALTEEDEEEEEWQKQSVPRIRYNPRNNNEMLFPEDNGGTTITGKTATPVAKMTGAAATVAQTSTPQIRYSPRTDTSLDAGLRYPVAKMTANNGTSQPAENTTERTIKLTSERMMTPEEKIENEQLAYERGLANYLQNNGAQTEGNGTVPIVEWFRKGQAENSVYDDAYNAAYDQILNAGGSYQQADSAGQAAGNMAVRQYRAEQPATPEVPVNEGTSLYDEIRAVQQSDAAQQQPQTTRNGSIKMTTSGGVSGGNTGSPQLSYSPVNNAGSGQAAQNGSVKMTTSGGVSRPGAAAALEDVMNTKQGAGVTYDPQTQAVIDAANAAGLTYGGANQPAATGNTPAVNTKAAGAASKVSGATTGSEATGTGTSGKKGTYFKPSYGQDMDKGVKLPYKAGGYTAAEIEAAGNKARSDEKYYTGDKAYEGYYLAPDGKYYPIDQEKAAYYIKNGGSYKGWEEPMREYYNTFGTFYGYRPDWKTAGGKNVWKQNNSSGRSYGGGYYNRSNNLSYSGGSAGSGRSYGRGSTANNGMYWNGNTSWSI